MPIEDDEKRKDVAYFLRDFKESILDKGLNVVNRIENRDALIGLGLTKRNREDEIMSLSVANYCSGPESDRDRPGHIWIFGKEIDGVEVYIKLKIFTLNGTDFAKCISFHKATSPLSYPFS